MDPPPPDDFDPYKLDEASYESDEGSQSDEHYKDGCCDTKTSDGGPKRPTRKPAPELPDFPHEKGSMLKDLLEFLIPPRDDRPENIRRWRISIGLAMVILYGHVLLACGWLQSLGFSGFAYASDVKSIKVELLEQRIFDARLRQCTATSQESRQFYASKVQELLSKFREAEGRTGGQYRLPTCDEVR